MQQKQLNRDVARLIVEAAMAAPSYGLISHAKALLSAFPVLHLNRETRAISRAFVYFGLHRPRTALTALNGIKSEEAQTLRTLINAYLEQAELKKSAFN